MYWLNNNKKVQLNDRVNNIGIGIGLLNWNQFYKKIKKTILNEKGRIDKIIFYKIVDWVLKLNFFNKVD